MKPNLKMSWALAVVLVASHALGTLGQAPRTRSDFTNHYAFGLYYVVSSKGSDDRALVISRDGKPIPPKENEPDAPTVPGYYTSYDKRFPFQRINFIGNEIRFRTLSVEDVRFEFSGNARAEIDPGFSGPIFNIKGLLRKYRNGKLVRTEKVTFGHAVIY